MVCGVQRFIHIILLLLAAFTSFLLVSILLEKVVCSYSKIVNVSKASE